MSKYQPNFQDPRVIQRCRHAYGFVRAVMSTEKPSHWSTRTIDRYFGQQQNKLSRYLRQQLLICTNHRFDKQQGLTKQYLINSAGLDFIGKILGKKQDNNSTTITPTVLQVNTIQEMDAVTADIFDYQLVNEYCQREYGEQLRNLCFEYQDKSNRLWNPIQNIRSCYRRPLLAQHGLGYDYDIEAAAANLIYQYSVQCGNDLYLPWLSQYLEDKTALRTHIARELDIPRTTAKIIINALFCGARIGNSPVFAISQLLSNDPARVSWLKQDPVVQGLRQDIRVCWQYIEPHTTRRYKNGRKLAMSSTQKWAVYFQLERQILNEVRNYLAKTTNRCFLQHDGFTTQQPIAITELSNYIYENTGYRVNFSEQIQDNNSPTTTPTVLEVGQLHHNTVTEVGQITGN